LSATEKPSPAKADPTEADPKVNKAKLVLITGLSGSGKSTVAKCFEDLNYYTVDNIPLPLLRDFLSRPLELVRGYDRIAVVTDVRAPGFAEEFPRLIGEIDRELLDVTLLFLESSDEVLVRRFSETRRPHPLAPDRPAIEGIEHERELLADLKAQADLLIDTSACSIHEIRAQIYHEFATTPGAEPGMVVSLVSFGFKHGIPYGTDLLFDVRFLSNPHFVPGLREKTGQDKAIQEYLGRQPEYGELIDRLVDLLAFLLPRYRRENRSYLSVAIGCTGGRHRSVAVAEMLKQRLEALDWPARLIHRDISR
jgi:UPF0042 nucleotide-binding protein